MMPSLLPMTGAPWDVLPPGVHPATLAEVHQTFATNVRRRLLYDGLLLAANALHAAGCGNLYLDGSFVTAKNTPNDYDACWDTTGVDRAKLDPVFLNFTNKRQAMKDKFGGEFFPKTMPNTATQSMFQFFQVERFTGNAKGILLIDLFTDCSLTRSAP